MNCLKELCIYQKDDKCMLDSIELDNNGCCESCIFVNIPSNLLEYEKENLRRRLEGKDIIL